MSRSDSWVRYPDNSLRSSPASLSEPVMAVAPPAPAAAGPAGLKAPSIAAAAPSEEELLQLFFTSLEGINLGTPWMHQLQDYIN